MARAYLMLYGMPGFSNAALNEAEVFEALKSLIGTTRVSGHTVSDGVLASFAERRLTYRPFSHAPDWAAFFLTGRT